MGVPLLTHVSISVISVVSIGAPFFQAAAVQSGEGRRSEVDNQLALANASQNADTVAVDQVNQPESGGGGGGRKILHFILNLQFRGPCFKVTFHLISLSLIT